MRRDNAGREVTEFYGDEQAAWLPFTSYMTDTGEVRGWKVGRINCEMGRGADSYEARAGASGKLPGCKPRTPRWTRRRPAPVRRPVECSIGSLPPICSACEPYEHENIGGNRRAELHQDAVTLAAIGPCAGAHLGADRGPGRQVDARGRPPLL